MKKYISSERVHLFEPNVYIQFLVNIAGRPSVEALVGAVKAAFMANESTMSKIVLENDGTAFYETMNASGCTVSVTQKEWQEIIRENEKIPFDIKHGELIRVFVIPSEAEMSLLIMAHHLVGDGKSIVFFLEDIMQALSQKKLQYKMINLVTKEYFSKESRLPFFARLYVNKFNRKWRNGGKNFTWDDYNQIHKNYWTEHSSKVQYESFSSEEINNIKSTANKMGVTLNSYIAAAFSKADTENHIIGFAVDARTGGGRSMSNQTTAIQINHTYRKRASFTKNANVVHRKIYKKLSNPTKKNFVLQFMLLMTPSLIDSVLLHKHGLYQNDITTKLTKVMGYSGKNKKDIGISNLTKLDIPNSFGAYSIVNILFIPPVVSYTKRSIGICTIETGMTISYHLMSDMNLEQEQNFFNRALQYIRSEAV